MVSVGFGAAGGGQERLRVEFRLDGMGLGSFKPDAILFHLAGVYAEASKRYWMLSTHLQELRTLG